MKSIGGITHENDIIDQKAKVFYDYFHYFLSENEYLFLQCQPLDNHLTILQKIDFRLSDNNLESSSKIVIKRLKDNDLFNLKADFVSRKGEIKAVIKKIKQNLSEKTLNLISLKSNIEEAIVKINGCYNYDQGKYLDDCLENLIHYLRCGCEYTEHKEEIIYFTKLIAAEFLRLGFSSKELTGVNGIVDKLLSKEIRIDEDTKYLFSRFPLPEEIERQRGTEQFEGVVTDFLENRTLKEQFKGIANYLKKDLLESIFIVRVKNAQIIEKSNFTYKKTEIISPAQIRYMGLGIDNRQKEYLERFLKPKNCVYLKIPLKYKSFNRAVDLAFKEAENALYYLSYPKPMRGEIDMGDILKFDNNSLGWKWKRERLIVNGERKYDLDDLDLNAKLYDQLADLDHLYFKSFTSRVLEDKIINAWRYFEMLGRYGDLNKNQKRIKGLPYILLNSEETHSKLHLEVLIANLIRNNKEVVNWQIPYARNDSVLKDQRNCIETLKNNSDYYFTNELIETLENLKPNFEKKYTLYKECFELLYEQRNFIIHQANICVLSAEQNIIFVHILLKRIRKSILADIKSHSRKELKISIMHLIREGKDLRI